MDDNRPEDALPRLIDGLYDAADHAKRASDKSRLRTAAEDLQKAPPNATAEVLDSVIAENAATD